MKKILMLVLIIFTLVTVEIMAEDFNKGLGFTAGKISGVGFAYRQYFEKNGMQFTFGLLSTGDKVPHFPNEYYEDYRVKRGWEMDGWVSAMYLRTLRESELSRFYYFVGASVNLDYTKKYKQEYIGGISSGSPVMTRHNDNSYYIGPGIGLDFRVSKYISFMIELPVSFSSDKKIDTYIPQGGVIVRF